MLGWELPPHNSGGLGVACYKLCKALSNVGADIEFIIPYDGDYDQSFMSVLPVNKIHYDKVIEKFLPYDNLKYEYTNSDKRHVNIGQVLDKYEEVVVKLVEVNEYDVIHAHDWLTFRAALKAKEITGKPLILHVHSIEKDRSGGGYGNPFMREIEETAMLIADKVIAVSNRTKEDIVREYGIPTDKVEVVYNSISQEDLYIENIDENAYKYLIKLKQHGYKIVANVGRMTIQKGLPNLLFAAKNVIKYEPKTIFVFVGDGEMQNELIELSAELGISKNVLFAGFQRGKRWRDAYQASDLFVMPSVSEPFGLTPLEAACYHVPTIISKQSGVSEIFKNSLKVDYWDIRKLSDYITAIVRNDSLSEELSNSAYQEYVKLSWNHSAKDVLKIYNGYVGQKV